MVNDAIDHWSLSEVKSNLVGNNYSNNTLLACTYHEIHAYI